ncbi:type 1 glutamine amidotransferase domain-containing protein [Vibrio mytili]|uniref:type 1 glutamine amidotransferase domain-containing protein n=1 Tax=Vibrio mytili TaxID=50718 RepID=UPI002F3E9401
MTKRILHVVTNVSKYDGSVTPTGLWLSELSHAYDEFEKHDYIQSIVSPLGGKCSLDPRSLKWPNLDKSARTWLSDERKMDRLENTLRPEQLNAEEFDVIYFTGGHAVMWDFPDNNEIQEITSTVFEQRGIVGSVCHGYCGLLNTRLSDGTLLVEGRNVTGFSWTEEVLAGVAKKMPYNAEQEMKERGAVYRKAILPFIPYVIEDGRLVTGQNPQSAKATAKRISRLLDNL